MIRIQDYSFKNKRVLLRVDYNVPLNEQFEITDTARIDASLPTLRKILDDGGSIILMSHLGRPKGKDPKCSLEHILNYLREVTKATVLFAGDCIGAEVESKVKALQPGQILLLENVRFYKEETDGNVEFARQLASYGDVYVNDAFATAHRAHATTAVIAQFFPKDKMFGFLMQKEIDELNKVMNSPKHPFTAILGGSKISTKIDIINNLLPKVDNLILGGGMNYTMHKALGGQVGKSLVEDEMLDVARGILKTAKEKNVNIYMSVDSITSDRFGNDAYRRIYPTNAIPAEMEGMDIGPQTALNYRDVIMNSSTILWNGPMGVFEFDLFSNGTFMVADAVAAATKKGAFSLVGGGDSVAAVHKFKMEGDVSYISTAGGAMLEFCEGRQLPGITCIMDE
ncbi:MAG: phosphoglycerate kinase [Bacteroidales bacterium]|nr:phosphoglycerate kinase [Bacteroidales bacterium]